MKTIRYIYWGTLCGMLSVYESPFVNTIIGMCLWYNIAQYLLPLSWFVSNSWWVIVWLSAGICFLVLQKMLLVKYEEETGLDHSNNMCGCKEAALNEQSK